jgi:hypothetical protein
LGTSEVRHSKSRRRALFALVAVLAVSAFLAFAGRDPSPTAVAGRAGAGPTSTSTSAAPAPSTTATPPSPQQRCADALAASAAAGLPLPAGAGYRCPSTLFAHHGASCWYAAQCPNGRFIAINLELMGDVSPAYLRYVVAHEVCHMIQFDAGLSSTEPEADACASAHGIRAG